MNVVSVHVDYGNRPASAQEASFVKRYSEDRLNIPCTIRQINEVTRGITARDEYEKIARTIRFDLYRAATAACLGEGNEESRGDEVGIILGHHRGDLRENVLSNAHKGCGPLDLSGMSSVSRNDGVMIYRPLLPWRRMMCFLTPTHLGFHTFWIRHPIGQPGANCATNCCPCWRKSTAKDQWQISLA